MNNKQFCAHFNRLSESHFSKFLNGKVNLSKGLTVAMQMIIVKTNGIYSDTNDDAFKHLAVRWKELSMAERYEVLAFVEKMIEKKETKV